MERSKSQLLELTRCGLWGGVPDEALFEEGVDWGVLLRLAKEQTLVGVISDAIERLPLSVRPSRVDGLRLHQMVTLNRQYREHHIVVMGRLIELLRSVGVERPVLLKGLGVGLNYPDPGLRQCGDLDVYVGDRHYFKVWDFICSEFGIRQEENHSDQHFDFDFMDTHIEIHRYATAPNSVAVGRREFTEWSTQQLEGDELRRVTINGVEIFLPPYNFDFIFIFYHTWRHFLTGGIGLRQLCDWGCYVAALTDRIDRVEVGRIMSLCRLERPISLFATIAVHSLGVSADKFEGLVSTSEPQSDKVLERIWQGGNFGFYREGRSVRSNNVFERKLHSFKAQLADMMFVLGVVDWRYTLRFYVPFFMGRFSIAFKHRKELGDRL